MTIAQFPPGPIEASQLLSYLNQIVAYINSSAGAGGGAVTSVAGKTGVVTLVPADVVGAAPLASPTFTGTVTGAAGTPVNTLQYNSAGVLAGSPLFVENANTVAQRNGVTAQAGFVYNTYTDASNYERGVCKWVGNQFLIGAESLGTGANRLVSVGSNPAGNPTAQLALNGTTTSFYSLAGTVIFSIGTGGLTAGTDATYDIGATGANRPRNAFLSGNIATNQATAVPAGGTTGTGITMSSVTNLGVFFGSGLPTLSAAQGSLYIRTDGSSITTRMYINTNGSTTWTNVTTAA